MSRRRHTISFKHAVDGIVHTFKTQPNLRIHLTIAVIVTIIGLALQITSMEWVVLIFTYMWVIISEMINTSIEAVVDLLTDKFHQKAKIAKDVAAGTVLVGAIGSVFIGLLIFIPYLVN